MLDAIIGAILEFLIPDHYGWRFWLPLIFSIIFCGLILLTPLSTNLKIAINLILIISAIYFGRKWDQTLR